MLGIGLSEAVANVLLPRLALIRDSRLVVAAIWLIEQLRIMAGKTVVLSGIPGVTVLVMGTASPANLIK